MTSLRRRVLQHLRDRIAGTPLALRLAFWDGETFDFAPAPKVTIAIGSRRVMRLFLTGNMARLGEAYVEGDLTVDGRLQDILEVGVELAERVGRSPLVQRVAKLGPLVRPLARLRASAHTRKSDAQAIGYHYDVSNAFYALWLDPHMIYSCAYFRTGAESIATAQEQKLDHICHKLRLKPGDRLLDIGCGWGGLLRWAARRYGVSGVGVTLSRQQHEYAEARCAAEGLAGQVEFRLQDYRDVPGEACFDKVVSVGMYEHVGLANLPPYFATIARLLAPGGVALNHGICVTDRDGHADGPPGGEFIDRYVFPGGELPHISKVLYEVAGSGLEITDMEDLRPHYPSTLLRWVRRLEANRDEAIRIAGEQRYRIWRMYMAGMAYAFDRGMLTVAQVLAVKPGPGGMAARPWTRESQYYLDEAPPLATGLDWEDA
jgi:cyclopropane-fatty-acyl-phospholipid synthase